MAGRYRGSRPLPDNQKVPWYRQAGRWLARRGYDVINTAVPGTLFDYREHGTVNPRQAFRDGSIAETLRPLGGRPEGMSDEEWQHVRQEGREGLFDTAWDLLPIPRIPVVSGYVRRGARNLLMPRGTQGNKPDSTFTVVPTVSGGGVTTTEAPVTTSTPPSGPRSGNSNNNSTEGSTDSRTNQSRNNSNNNTGKPVRFSPFAGNTSGTRGTGWEGVDDPQSFMNLLSMAGSGYSGIGYQGAVNHDKPFLPSAFMEPEIINTTTGLPFNRGTVNRSAGAGREYDWAASRPQRV